MFREGGFRGALRRQVDAIPLPIEGEWVPTGERSRSMDTAFMAGAAIIGVLLFASIIVSALSRVPERGGVLASPAPPVRPTTAPDGRRIAPLPNAVRNTQYGYNLVVQRWFRQTTLPVGVESDSGLLYREVFSARDDQVAMPVTASTFLPWDLIVEVWQRGDRPAEDWAATFGCHASPSVTPSCSLTTVEIRGTRALLGTIGVPVRGTLYLVERGDQLLVFRYATSDEVEAPPDVTEELLDRIVRSVGLP